MAGKDLTQKDRFYIEKSLACNVSRYEITNELGASSLTAYREVELTPQQLLISCILIVGSDVGTI